MHKEHKEIQTEFQILGNKIPFFNKRLELAKDFRYLRISTGRTARKFKLHCWPSRGVRPQVSFFFRDTRRHDL